MVMMMETAIMMVTNQQYLWPFTEVKDNFKRHELRTPLPISYFNTLTLSAVMTGKTKSSGHCITV